MRLDLSIIKLTIQNSLPELSLDRVAKIGQLALTQLPAQLPWVCGTAAVVAFPYARFSLRSYAVLTLGIYGIWGYKLSQAIQQEDAEPFAQHLLLGLKTLIAAATVLLLGQAVGLGWNGAKTAWQTAAFLYSHGRCSIRSQLPILGLALYRLYIAGLLLSNGLAMKSLIPHIEGKKPFFYLLREGALEARLDKALTALDGLHLLRIGDLIPLLLPAEEIKKSFWHYARLQNTERAFHLFPCMLERPELFNDLLKTLLPHNFVLHQSLFNSIVHKYASPISGLDIDTLGCWISDFPVAQNPEHAEALLSRFQENLQQIEQLEIVVSELPDFGYEQSLWLSLNENGIAIMEHVEETRRLAALVKPLKKSLFEHGKESLRARLIAQRLEYIEPALRRSLEDVLAEKGVMFADYENLSQELVLSSTSPLSVKKRVLEKLNDKGVYCLQDLLQKNIVAEEGGSTEETVKRLGLYLLSGERLSPLPAQTASSPLATKVRRIARVFFHLALKIPSTGLRFYFTPYTTSAGIIGGLTINSPQVQRYNQTARLVLATANPSKTSSYFTHVSAFSTGIKLGAQLRSYLM